MDKQLYQKFLAEACKKEIEAYDFYLQIAGKIKDTFVRRVITDIAEMELKHFEQLRKLTQQDPARLQFPPIENFVNVTTPNSVPAVRLDMSAAEAVKLAIIMEKTAIEQYARMAAFATSAEDKQMYLKLMEMEHGHQCSFEKILLDIDSWNKK